MFQDITTLLLNPKAFKDTIDLFVERYKDKDISVVAGNYISLNFVALVYEFCIWFGLGYSYKCFVCSNLHYLMDVKHG